MDWTIKEIEDEVKDEYPTNYYKDAYEAIFDAKLQNAWLETEDAKQVNGEENCKKQIVENNIQIDKAEKKMKFIKKYFKLK